MARISAGRVARLSHWGARFGQSLRDKLHQRGVDREIWRGGNREADRVMKPDSGADITRARSEATFKVDLPLDTHCVNESLFAIGLWLIAREISHSARISMEPQDGRIRVSLPDADAARNFGERFAQRRVA